MARIYKPLFGDTATGGIADLITFRTIDGKASAGIRQQQTVERSIAQQEQNQRYAIAHAAWMLLQKQRVYINKRYYWRRIPDWKTYWRAWPGPAAPANLTATATSTSQINLTWTDNSNNEDDFEVQSKVGEAGQWATRKTVSANTTSTADTELTQGTAYYYRVRARNVVASSEFTNEAHDTTWLPAAPAAPSNLTAIEESQSVINLSWTDNSNNEDGFKIERKTGTEGSWSQIGTANQNETTYRSTGLTAATTYYYRIRAYNGTGDSDYSGEATATTRAVAAPSNLTATATSSTQISLAWTDNSEDEAGFRVERKLGTDGTWAQIAQLMMNATTWNNTDLPQATRYFYRVKAYNTYGESALSNEADATTMEEQCVFPIELTQSLNGTWSTACVSTHREESYARYYTITVTTAGTGVFDLTSTEDNYLYLLSGAGASGEVITQANSGGGGTNARITRALDVGDYTLEATTFYPSTAGSFTISTAFETALPAAPSNLTATTVSSTQIDLAWTDNSDNESGFKVERKLDVGGTWAQIAQLAAGATGYSNTGLLGASTYYYRVRAYNPVGDSEFSNEANATTQGEQCVFPINLVQTINGTWISACASTHRAGRYARYYTFTLTTTGAGVFNLISTEDTYLYLLNGTGAGGTVITEDDDSGDGSNSRITRTLAAGDYTLEATTFTAGKTGSFTISSAIVTAPPAAPSGLTATATSESQINLTWTDNSDNETSFKIERKTGSGGTWAQIATTGENVAAYNNTGLTPSTQYYYRVRASNGIGNSDYSGEANATTQALVCIFPIAEGETLAGSWISACASTHRAGRYARFYTFTLAATKTVTIDLISTKDTYMYLLDGTGTGGAVITEDDDSGDGSNSRIVRSLAAGNYTIEATTYAAATTGSFTIRLLTA